MSRLILLAFYAVAHAATLYVSVNGNDANLGTQSAPFRHVSKGASTARPGDTVIVMDGTYDNEGKISDGSGGMHSYAAPVVLASAGTPTAWITIKAQNKGNAILDCGTTVTALGCDKYIYLNPGVAYWSFQDLVFTRGAYGGLGTDYSASHIRVTGCSFQYIGQWNDPTQIGESGIGFDAGASDWYIANNVFHDIGRLQVSNLDHGIYAAGTNVVIIDNTFYAINRGWGIQVSNGAVNWLIANNSFAATMPTQGGLIMLWNTIKWINIVNNTLAWPGGGVGISQYTATLSGCVIDGNTITGPTVVMANPAGCSGTNSISSTLFGVRYNSKAVKLP